MAITLILNGNVTIFTVVVLSNNWMSESKRRRNNTKNKSKNKNSMSYTTRDTTVIFSITLGTMQSNHFQYHHEDWLLEEVKTWPPADPLAGSRQLEAVLQMCVLLALSTPRSCYKDTAWERTVLRLWGVGMWLNPVKISI